MNPKEKQPSFGGGPSWLRLAKDKDVEAVVAAADAPASGCRCFVPVGCSGAVPVAYSRRCTRVAPKTINTRSCINSLW